MTHEEYMTVAQKLADEVKAAYKSGFERGHHAGYQAGMATARKIVDQHLGTYSMSKSLLKAVP